MDLLTQIVIIINALVHLVFAIGEIFFAVPALQGLLGYNSSDAQKTAPVAQNAGIYNSFIAVGLFWSAFAIDNTFRLRLFFLICVAIAGIFGALTLPSKDPTQPRNIKTLFLQTLPATIAIVLVWIN